MGKRALFLVLAVLLTLTVFPLTVSARDELKNTDPEKYYILLDTKNQVVTVYEKDEAGEYTKIVRRMICTSGRTELDPEDPEDKGTPTPKGIWKIGARERFGKFASFGNEYARYWTQIVGGVYFHSIMFRDRTVNSLKSGAYRGLGSSGSHGCVRLYVEDAKWLYYNACPGTTIKVSHNEKKDGSLRAALKSKMSFERYNELQKNFYDEPELPNRTAWTVIDNADVRSGNGSEDRVLFKVPKDTPLEVLQEGDPWCKVKYNNKEGYVRLAYLTYEYGTINSKEDADLIKATCYIYEQPERGAEEIVKVPTYTSVKVLERRDGWAKIEYFNEQGWLKESSLTTGWGTIRE